MWEGNADALYLTFDDGPHPEASSNVLRFLEKEGLKATFFLSGVKVEAFPDIAREITTSGHTIGNHGFSHKQLVIRNKREIEDEIRKGSEMILQMTGVRPSLFRPPYGMFRRRTLNISREIGHQVVMFTIDTGDYSSKPLERLSKRLEHLVKPGAIFLFHDSMKAVSKTIPLLEKTVELASRLSIPIKPVTGKVWN